MWFLEQGLNVSLWNLNERDAARFLRICFHSIPETPDGQTSDFSAELQLCSLF